MNSLTVDIFTPNQALVWQRCQHEYFGVDGEWDGINSFVKGGGVTSFVQQVSSFLNFLWGNLAGGEINV